MRELKENKKNVTENTSEVVPSEVDGETAELDETKVENTQEEENATPNSPQTPPNLEEVKGRWWLKYVITAVVLAVFTVLVAWWRGAFEATDPKELLRQLSDAFFVPGILAVCFGLLIVASNGGTFDMLAYGVRSLFRLFKKDPIDRKYGGYYGYRKAKQKNKRSFWYLVIVGAAYLLVGIVLAICYATV